MYKYRQKKNTTISKVWNPIYINMDGLVFYGLNKISWNPKALYPKIHLVHNKMYIKNVWNIPTTEVVYTLNNYLKCLNGDMHNPMDTTSKL